VQISRGEAVLYSDSNYQGTCTVLYGNTPNLAQTAAGNDTVSSLILDGNCYSAIHAVKVVSGSTASVSCGSGWAQVHTDLNQGAGGDYIYLCYQWGSPYVAQTGNWHVLDSLYAVSSATMQGLARALATGWLMAT
jgi:hypothetical protein